MQARAGMGRGKSGKGPLRKGRGELREHLSSVFLSTNLQTEWHPKHKNNPKTLECDHCQVNIEFQIKSGDWNGEPASRSGSIERSRRNHLPLLHWGWRAKHGGCQVGSGRHLTGYDM